MIPADTVYLKYSCDYSKNVSGVLRSLQYEIYSYFLIEVGISSVSDLEVLESKGLKEMTLKAPYSEGVMMKVLEGLNSLANKGITLKELFISGSKEKPLTFIKYRQVNNLHIFTSGNLVLVSNFYFEDGFSTNSISLEKLELLEKKNLKYYCIGKGLVLMPWESFVVLDKSNTFYLVDFFEKEVFSRKILNPSK